MSSTVRLLRHASIRLQQICYHHELNNFRAATRVRRPIFPSRDTPSAVARSFSTTRSLFQEPREGSAHSSLPLADITPRPDDKLHFTSTLPVLCPGCGALSQTVESDAPGFYSPKRRHTKQSQAKARQGEDAIFEQAMARLSESSNDGTDTGGLSEPDAVKPVSDIERAPSVLICDRCHDLLYQSKGNSILHPSMRSIQSIIESSPHKHNHIYHVLDAADFPMSLIPNLISALKLPRLRTQNRRSKSRTHVDGRQAEVSFIITRSDLLAPQKEQVDRMMPYLQDVLRDALGRTGRNLRLGNVRCVSAKRGWWTRNVKEEIWDRGGAGWVVGKVNVGKSALFEVVFPKGRDHAAEDTKIKAIRDPNRSQVAREDDVAGLYAAADVEGAEQGDALSGLNDSRDPALAGGTTVRLTPAIDQFLEDDKYDKNNENDQADDVDEDELSLLPPAQPEVQYPQMPIVSALPGTTASPIRIPYGRGKGELIDLPGVHRSSLETHVKPEHRSSLVMKSRVVPEQHAIKPGQSLLIGGIIRITPKTEDHIFLAYPFTPLDAHATANEKAIAIQTGVLEDGSAYTGKVGNIGTDTAKQRIKSAGKFKLEWDVTKQRTGSLTDKAAGKQKTENLPFIVYSADVLIEGVGWVELVCQVRNRRKSLITDALSTELGEISSPSDLRPEIEVFTPKGKFIGIRKPMNAWVVGGPKKIAKHAQRARPRMSISMHRRREGGKQSTGKASATPN